MAGELYLSNPGDAATIYVVVRRVSDMKVWSVAGTDWATWANGSIADYDIALTSMGGDVYQGDFPTSITAGTRVLAMYYKQVGASPAITDTLLLTTDVTWSGAVLSSASSISLDSRALTTLASVKRHLRISDTTYDTLLTELINQVSDRIEREAGRRFAAAEYNEWINPDGEESFTVRNWPIIRVNRVRYSTEQAINLAYSGSDVEAVASVYYDEEGNNGYLKLLSIAAAGTETSNTFAFATYPTLSTLVTAADAISGWAVTRASARDGQSACLAPIGGIDAKNVAAELYGVTEFDYTYRVKHRDGILTGGRSCGLRLVSYRGGYDPIPDDVVRLANELIASAYYLGTKDQLIQSESIPDYSYTLTNSVEMTQSQRSTLDAYRSIAIGGAA